MSRGRKSQQDIVAAALLTVAGDDLQTLARMAAERIVKLEKALAELEGRGEGAA